MVVRLIERSSVIALWMDFRTGDLFIKGITISVTTLCWCFCIFSYGFPLLVFSFFCCPCCFCFSVVMVCLWSWLCNYVAWASCVLLVLRALLIKFCCYKKKRSFLSTKWLCFIAVIITHIHVFGVLTIVLLLPVKFEFHVKS
jgi:hypothetical protein